MCCYLAWSTTKTVKTSYFGLVSPCSYKRPEASCHTQDNWIPRKTSHLENELLVHFTVGHTVVFLLWWQHSVSSRFTAHAQDRSDVVSFPHLSPPSSPEKLSEWTSDSITHSEANAFTVHRHGLLQSVITALWLQPSHFSNNAQMYQLLLLCNENRWETGDKPCL